MCPVGEVSQGEEDTLADFKVAHGDRYAYVPETYVDTSTPMEILCNLHGSFRQRPSKHKNGLGCPACGRLKTTAASSKDLVWFLQRAQEVHPSNYDYSHVTYKNNLTKIQINCKEHGPFQQTPGNHLMGNGCPKCADKTSASLRSLAFGEFVVRSVKLHCNRFEYSEASYSHRTAPTKIFCKTHAIWFSQIADWHLSGSRGCPECRNRSRGEWAIKHLLETYQVRFEEQKTFEGCRAKRLLRFDFYIPDLNTAIEFDGFQHFRPTNWNGKATPEQMESRFKRTQLHDQIKNDHCKANNIDLIRIAYNENIQEKLKPLLESIGK